MQYADFLGPRTSFLLVTIPSEVSRGVVARSVAALAKGRNRVLGYVENMSGYYCRDCNAIKPLFVSPECRPTSGSRASGQCHSIPSWRGTATAEFPARNCAVERQSDGHSNTLRSELLESLASLRARFA